jgi:presenilin-like A22 family membrane protease
MSRSKIRWLILGIIVIAAMHQAVVSFEFYGYVQSWGGTAFKALSGGLIGWAVSRFVIGLDISELPDDQRPEAALSQSLLIAGFALALATGA